MFESIKLRMPKGFLYQQKQYYHTVHRLFPQEVLERKLYSVWKSRYYHLFRDTNVLKQLAELFANQFIECNGKMIVTPRKEDINTFLWEYPDLVLPMRIHDFEYEKLSHLFHEGPYELSTKVCVKAGDVVIDCGANMGYFCSAVADRAQTIYAFEPSVEIGNYYLCKLKKIYPNIEIEQMALAKETGKKEFCFCENSCGESFLAETLQIESNKKEMIGNQTIIECTTVDEFVKTNRLERVDFIKADIEGGERNMLLGARDTLKEMAPKLSICTYHLEDDKEVLEKIVLEANPSYHIIHKYQKMYAYVE